jgi:hypothetical protein
MVSLTALWLPILLSAVVVFIASSVIHMFLTYHQTDFRKLANEDEIRAAFRSADNAPGVYMFPAPDNPKEMHSEEMKNKFREGPNGFVTVHPPGWPNMGKALPLWFVYCVGIGVMTAYVTGRTMPPGEEYLTVFRVAGTVAFLSYSGAHMADSIWVGAPWSNTLKSVFDGLVYGLLTGGVFGWLWPN